MTRESVLTPDAPRPLGPYSQAVTAGGFDLRESHIEGGHGAPERASAMQSISTSMPVGRRPISTVERAG